MNKETQWSKFYKDLQFHEKIDSSMTLYEALCAEVIKHPERTAIIYASRKISFAEFKDLIDQAASYLLSIGVKKGDKLLLCAAGLPSVGIMVYAASAVGAIASLICGDYKPQLFKEYVDEFKFNYLIFTDKQIEKYISILNQTSIKEIIVSKPNDFISNIQILSARLKGYLRKFYRPDYKNISNEIKIHQWEEILETKIDLEAIKRRQEEVSSSDLVLAVFENNTHKKRMVTPYSSASVIENANITGILFDPIKDEKDVEKHLCFIDLMYAAGFILGFNSVLLYGHTVCLKSWGDNSVPILQMNFYRPDVIMGFPTILNEIADTYYKKAGSFINLKKVICYGFPLNGVEHNRYYTVFRRVVRDVRIEKVYGVAETASVYAYNPPELDNSRILGIPLPGVRIKIFDEDANELPIGQQGRICVSTPSSAIISDNVMNSTIKKQLRDEREWVFTGTLGHMDENNFIYFDGSLTRKFDVNGRYFYPYHLENEILQVDGVKDCLVFVHSGDMKIIAAVVPDEKYLFDNDLLLELKSEIEHHTEIAYHTYMRQSEIEFRVSLPKTNRGDNDYTEFGIQYEEKITLLLEEAVENEL